MSQQRVLFVVVLSLAVIFLVQWNASYRQIEAFRLSLVDATGRISRSLERQRLALQASIAGLNARLEERSAPAPDASLLAAQPRFENDLTNDDAPSADDGPTSDPDGVDSLPALPAGFDAERFLRQSRYRLADLLADPLLNPGGVELTRVGRLQALESLTTAHARRQILESQIQSTLAREMETLRERGDYLEYPPGTAAEPVGPEVLTSGERAPDGGLRLFLFHPEEFPEIFAKKHEIGIEAERAVRGVLSILADE